MAVSGHRGVKDVPEQGLSRSVVATPYGVGGVPRQLHEVEQLGVIDSIEASQHVVDNLRTVFYEVLLALGSAGQGEQPFDVFRARCPDQADTVLFGDGKELRPLRGTQCLQVLRQQVLDAGADLAEGLEEPRGQQEAVPFAAAVPATGRGPWPLRRRRRGFALPGFG
ncbi:hypothetical protein [Streptomyces sp. NBC_00454]|uniref:hypothetical protein n=1 Tax=Streptomyces sp. NBC_00454 TaxID=2975747 RepID=UPI0030E1BF2C